MDKNMLIINKRHEMPRNCIDIAHQLHLKMLTNCIEK